MKADTTKTLAEIGVQRGWFCRHSGCSIWLEVLRVYDTALVCVSRDPKKVTDYVSHYAGWGGIWDLSETQPNGDVIFSNREKNFFDRHFPE